jgi:invasion protein IalB
MKGIIIGLALALAFVAAIFAADRFFPHELVSQTRDVAASVKPGFQGAKRIGAWTLFCAQGTAQEPQQAAIPFALTPRSSARQPLGGQLGRCHVSLVVANKQRQALMSANFRLTSRQQAVTLILRFSPMAKKGDSVVVKLNTSDFRVPVADCTAKECLALGMLPDRLQATLFAAPTATFIFPAGPGGKRPALRLPLTGLGDAVSLRTKPCGAKATAQSDVVAR